MPAVSRLGDSGIHIGSGETGSITAVSSVMVQTADNKPIALTGDSYTCSISHHGTNPLVPLVQQVDTLSGGKQVITVGSRSECGATIINGFPATLTKPPAPPIAVASFSATTQIDTPLDIPVSSLTATGLDLDLLALSLVSVQNTVNGTTVIVPSGSVIFTPATLYVGPASFEYTLGSINGNISFTANITVTL